MARTAAAIRAGSGVIGLISVALALILSGQCTPFAGFAYLLMAAWIPLFGRWRFARMPG